MSKKFSEKILAIQLAFLIAFGVIALFIFQACDNGANSGNGPDIKEMVEQCQKKPDHPPLASGLTVRLEEEFFLRN
jgi:hypothetical protein